MKTNKLHTLWALTCFVFSMAFTAPAHAAANALDGTSWDFSLAASASVSKAGKLVTVGNSTFEFFNGNEFRILDEDEIEVLSGTYTIDAKGKAVLAPDTSDLQSFINEWVWDVLDSNLDPAVQVNFSPSDIAVQKLTFTAVLKSTPTLLTLKIKANINASVDAIVTDDAGTDSITGKTALKFVGVAYQDLAAYNASTWALPNASEKASVSGYGALASTTPMFLSLNAKTEGPSDSLPGFQISDNAGTSFSGTYLRNKNKLTFFFDTDSIEQVMENAIIQQLQQQYGYSLDSSDIWIDVTKIKSAASIKNEQNLKFSIQAAYTCYVIINNELLVLKSSYALKGNGVIQ